MPLLVAEAAVIAASTAKFMTPCVVELRLLSLVAASTTIPREAALGRVIVRASDRASGASITLPSASTSKSSKLITAVVPERVLVLMSRLAASMSITSGVASVKVILPVLEPSPKKPAVAK